jgi:hypothetical protein
MPKPRGGKNKVEVGHFSIFDKFSVLKIGFFPSFVAKIGHWQEKEVSWRAP